MIMSASFKFQLLAIEEIRCHGGLMAWMGLDDN